MQNRYIEYEDDYENNSYNLKKNNIKKYLIYVIIAFLLIIGFFVYRYFNSYAFYEKKLSRAASKYIQNNGNIANKEVYLDAIKLKVDLPSNCSLVSGVLYDGRYFQPLLMCSDYQSPAINNNISDITLLGDNYVVLLKGMEYDEPGFVSRSEVVTSGSVGTEEGVYTINYYVNNINIPRKVIVINNPQLLREFPTLNIIGEKEVNLEKGKAYQENGVKAFDNIDGDITKNVQITNMVDVNNIGEYKILYKITNQRGYTVTKTRKVIVEGDDASSIISGLSTYGLTNKNVKILFNILSTNYSNTILPNKEKTTNKNFEYEVDKNGTYEFKVNDIYGNTIIRKVDVKNIDKTNPNGTCTAVIYNNRTEIVTKVPDNKVIVKYTYIIDGVPYESISDVYQTDKIPNIISVKMRDSSGNDNILVCKKEEKKSSIPENGIVRIIEGSPLTTPIAEALAKRNYTVNDLNMCIGNKVRDAIPGTRNGVVAAAVGLLDCMKDMLGYTLPYDHTGGKVETERDGINYCNYNSDICGKLGINTRWGKLGGSCDNEPCYLGLNCANFVHWALCNGGMDMCTKGSPGATSMSSQKYFPEADSFKIYKRKVSHQYGTDLTAYGADALIRMIKPGDLVHSYDTEDYAKTDHIMVVIGVDDSGVYIAENGRKTRKILYSDFISGRRTYQIVLLDKYYNNPNNQNHLYN